MKIFSVLFYLGSILLANWLVIQYGLVEFAGLVFPAGAIAIGFTFTARDYVQRSFGKWTCWIWMFAASIITALLSPTLAAASVAAFMIGEGVDWAVFTYTRGSFPRRVCLSNLIGLPLDSIVFVWIAFGWHPQAMYGQAIVKIISSVIILGLFQVVRRRNGTDWHRWR